jgi:hypothetical protein
MNGAEMIIEKTTSMRLKHIGVYSLIFTLICITVAVSIIFRDQNNVNWLLIGLCKFAVTFLLVIIAFRNIRNSLFELKPSLFIIIAILLEALCDLFIEYSFTIGGVLSLMGLVFYSLSFIKASNKKISKKRATAFSSMCICGFLFAQFLITYQKHSFLLATDGVFILYMIVLSATTGIALSSGIVNRVKIGMFVFYLSDFIVYFQMAHGLLPIYRIGNAILYYGAQIIMVYSIFQSDAVKENPEPIST